MILMGGSFFLQSSICQSSSSSYFSQRKVVRKKRCNFGNVGGQLEEICSFQRRDFFFVGISVLPFLQLREVFAEDQVEEISAVSHVGSLANIFLSQRNRSKAFGANVLGNSALEEKMGTGIQESQGTILKESDIDTSNSVAMEIASQAPNATKHEVDAQPPEIKELEILPKQSKENAKETLVGSSFLSFLNGIGVIGSGVLGALFAASQQEKKALESTIDSMKAQANDQEIAATSMKQSFEARLLNDQEEHKRHIMKLKDEGASLSTQLTSAKESVAALGRELKDERRLVEELISQKAELEHSFMQAREDKKLLADELDEKVDRITSLQDKLSVVSLEIKENMMNIENLKSLLDKKESECKNLSSTMEQTKEELASANSCIEQLKEDIIMTREESNSKGLIIDDQHEKINSLSEEKDVSNNKFFDLMKDYNDLVSYSERTTVLNSELLSNKDEKLHQLEENLKLASNEASFNQTIISDLTIEKDNVIMLLEKERNDVYKLRNELHNAQQLLETSKEEVSLMSKELSEAKASYEEVMSTIFKMQDEYDQAKKLLNYNLEEAKTTSMILSDKLESSKVILKSTKEELAYASNELNSAIEERESLKKELVDSYHMVETTTNQMQEERKIVTNLNKDIEALSKQILNDSEVRKSLEADLDKATKSLDEMNDSSLLLSRELENTNSRSTSLETEKEVLYKSLIEQKNISKVALENIEDAQNVITSLGSEREKLEKRSKRLEEELSATKGEILRLRRKIDVGQKSIVEHDSKSNEVPSGTPFSVKRNAGRRKKPTLGSDNS